MYRDLALTATISSRVVATLVLAVTGACTDGVPSAPSASASFAAAAGPISGHDYAAIDLGALGTTPNGTSTSIALDISAGDAVVGETSTTEGTRAFLWTADAGMRNLGVAGSGDTFSRAHAINESGWVVGTSGSTREQATLWKPGEPGVRLTGIPGRGSAALDIDNSGRIVGAYETDDDRLRAFLWQNGAFRDLGTLSGNFSRAFGINDAGQIVGGSQTSPTFAEHAVVFDALAGTATSLGVVEALGAQRAIARAINSSGVVVGAVLPGVSGVNGFIWRPGQGATGLSSGIDAMDINDDGRIAGAIVGNPTLWDPVAGVLWLPTLGGSGGKANAINNAGTAAGQSVTATGLLRATLWRLNRMPVADAGGRYVGQKKKPIAFDGSRSSDPDGDALTYEWVFGDDTPPAAGAAVTHAYDSWGTYTVTLTVRDPGGLFATTTTTATIAPPGKLK